MKILLVASADRHHADSIERHIATLASGLARRGVSVELLVQDPVRVLPRALSAEGLVVRQFTAPLGNGRSVGPRLWEHLCGVAASFDLVDVHSSHAGLGLAVASARPRHMVFNTHASVEHMLRWPNTPMTRAMIERAHQIVCTSRAQADLLCRKFPSAKSRVSTVPYGVDLAAIDAAQPIHENGNVLFTVAGREPECVRRVIAALPGLDASSSLIVAGDKRAQPSLQAYAADLDVSWRVGFLDLVSEEDRYRWLKTARVLVTLSEQEVSGQRLLEALAARTHVVASDTPVHREAASHVGGVGFSFVSPRGSPIELAEAISGVAKIRLPAATRLRVPTWDAAVDIKLALYESLVAGNPGSNGRRNGAPELPVPSADGALGTSADGAPAVRG